MSDRKARTLIVSGQKVKDLFKVECTYNGLDMSIVTETLWKSYVVASIKRRRERAEEYNEIKLKNNE